jgi:hypothetical protein
MLAPVSMADGYYQCRTHAAAYAWAPRGCRWRKIPARHLEGGKAMSAVRIHQYGKPDALSRGAAAVPDSAGAHAPSASGRAVDKMLLPAGMP